MTGDRTEKLARELRRWAERPTELSPGQARDRVLARLPRRRDRFGWRRPGWQLAAAGSALAAIALALALVVGGRPEPITEPAAPAGRVAQRTIVHQLSSGTKLYIVVRPAAFANGT